MIGYVYLNQEENIRNGTNFYLRRQISGNLQRFHSSKKLLFPIRCSKKISFGDIKSLVIHKPSLATGQGRIWGSGDLMTWFPLDIFRFKRDRIFKLTLNSQKIRVGFTVENSADVIQIFRQKGL